MVSIEVELVVSENSRKEKNCPYKQVKAQSLVPFRHLMMKGVA